jgi:uncharacterized membrane protein YecN with MAPEG domain
MQAITFGAGLAALGFWLFIAAVSVVAIWAEARKREAQHETLRHMIESGQPVDRALMEALLAQGEGGTKRLDRDLRMGGLIVLFVAVGLALMGWLIGLEYAEWWLPILGVAALVGCIAIGLLVASALVVGWRRQDEA